MFPYGLPYTPSSRDVTCTSDTFEVKIALFRAGNEEVGNLHASFKLQKSIPCKKLHIHSLSFRTRSLHFSF